MRRFKPSYTVSILGLASLATATIIGSVAIGAMVTVFARLGYIPILEPMLMGVAGFFIIGFTIEKTKMPNPVLAVLFGTLIGFLAYGLHHYGEYLVFRHEGMQTIREELLATYGDIGTESAAEVFTRFLEEETGNRGFLGYLHWTVQTGIRFLASYEVGMPEEILSSKPVLRHGWVWGYWAVEALLAIGVATWGTIKFARQPFCKGCRDWYHEERHLGKVSSTHAQRFLDSLKSGDSILAARLISRMGRLAPKDLEIKLQSCASCPASDIVLLVNQVLPSRQQGIFPKRVFEGLMTPDEYRTFSSGIGLR